MQTPEDLSQPLVLEALQARLRGRRNPLFLDYDGTLTPIVDNPEEARLDPAMRAALEQLAADRPVALVSGRDLQTLQAFVGLESVYYAGSHGFEIVGPGGIHHRHEAAEAGLGSLETAARALDEALAYIPGTTLERKRFALAVHYRNVAPGAQADVATRVNEVVAQHPDLRRGIGKKVFELQPDVEWDKGRAVLWLLETLGLDGDDALPLYLGDDWTDEDAFRALQGRGAGIFVGELDRPTAAEYRLGGVHEVRAFFELLLQGANR